MGHRFESLSLPAHLVAWHDAGLELVRREMLGDAAAVPGAISTDALVADGGGVDVSAARLTSTPDAPGPAGHARDVRSGRGEVVAQAAQAAGQAPGGPGARQAPAGAQPHGATHAAATSSPSSSDMPGGSEPCAWTGPFLYALERLKPPVRAMWTYWELALDFGGDPDSARRQLWANIIKSLPYKQRVGFWPVSEMQGGVMLAKPALFWQGVREFGATHVLCFGRRACMTLFPDRPFAPGVFRHGDLTVVLLPGPDDMLPDNRQAKSVAWGLLKDLHI